VTKLTILSEEIWKSTSSRRRYYIYLYRNYTNTLSTTRNVIYM